MTKQQTLLEKLTTRGLAQRIVNALSTLTGSDSGSYYTSADVAFRLMSQHCSNCKDNYLSAADFGKFTNLISTSISQMITNNRGGIIKNNTRQTALIAIQHYSNINAATGFRIGAPMVPVINADIVAENRIQREALEDFNKNPLEVMEKLIQTLDFKTLSDLMMSILARKDELYTASLHAAAEAKQKVRAAEKLFAAQE